MIAKLVFETGLVGLILWSIAAGDPAFADDFSRDTRFFKQLTTPMNSILDGRSFRSGLEKIAAQVGLNLWIDRHVDPDLLIQTGPIGPTVYAAIDDLAKSQGCTVMPVANVVLVGREIWVQRTASTLIAIPESTRRGSINVSWQDLTTPSEALQKVNASGTNDRNPKSESDLPHDLWPAVSWQNISRSVAVALILAQFDPGSTPGESSPADSAVLTRRYSQNAIDQTRLLKSMATADPSSRVRASGPWLIANGDFAAHHSAVDTILRQTANSSGPDPDRDTFTLKKMTTSAENALRQLAQTAGKTCVIEERARAACQKMISIEGRDVTLRQLIDRVARQAGVVASWQGDQIMIKPAP